MNTGIDIKFVRERYAQMTDGELIQKATEDASGLTPEAVAVVKEEILKRGLNAAIIAGLEAQNKTYSIDELDQYCDLIAELNCPLCGSRNSRINATMVKEVMSFILITNYSSKIKVGCQSCLDKANESATLKTALLGWWGFPWGLIRTPMALFANVKKQTINK